MTSNEIEKSAVAIEEPILEERAALGVIHFQSCEFSTNFVPAMKNGSHLRDGK